jgi:hypothetical protein
MSKVDLAIRRSVLGDRKNDLYQTPPVAVQTLLRVEKLPPCIWEPACGPGAIVSVLRSAGHTVVATDLIDYRCPEQQSGVDFLLEQKPPNGVSAIVSNAPYKLGADFVRRALALVPETFLLLRIDFYSSMSRADIFDDGSGFRGIHVFANRLPAMHREDWTGPRVSSPVTYGWFCWSRGYTGRPFANRVTWRHEPALSTTLLSGDAPLEGS